MALLEANLGILLRARRDPVLSCSADTQTCNCVWKSYAKILGHMGGGAGRQGGFCAQENWAGGLRKPSSHGNDAKEGSVSRIKAEESSGNWPSFVVSVLLTV